MFKTAKRSDRRLLAVLSCAAVFLTILFAGDRADPGSALSDRVRSAAQDRRGGERSTDDVEVFLDRVTAHRFDKHHAAVVGKAFECVLGRSGRVAHVVQAIEEGDQIKLFVRVVGGRRDVELDPVGDAGLLGPLAGGLDRLRMAVVSVDS